MRITQITVARLINTGNYENTRVELTALLDERDLLAEVAEQLHLMTVDLFRRERERRYPDDTTRRYHLWTEEDERAIEREMQERRAGADAEMAAARAAGALGAVPD
jgi:hypothetical protein